MPGFPAMDTKVNRNKIIIESTLWFFVDLHSRVLKQLETST